MTSESICGKDTKNSAVVGQSLCKDAILYPDFSDLKYLLENEEVTISTPLVHPAEIRKPRNQSITRLDQYPGQESNPKR